MARQVYYDPFGMRTAGYQAGVGDEQAVQGATRAARQLDWDFGMMNPLRLQAAQREEQFQQYGDPFRRRGLVDAEYDANTTRAADFGFRSGNWQPQQRLDFARFFGQEQLFPDISSSTYNPETGRYENFGLYGPTGEFAPYNASPQSYAEAYGMRDPAVSTYMLNNAQMEQAYRLQEAQMRQKAQWAQIQYDWMRANGANADGMGLFNPFE